MKAFFRLALVGLALAVGATGARADLITFTSDSTGAKPNGWSSAESGYVTFTDSIGANLDVFNYGIQSHGNGMAVNGDDPSILIMNFAGYAVDFSLEFGNDDPGWTNAGDAAYLRLYDGATLVGSTSVVMNRDDIMNQAISINGVVFDRAEFWYGRPSNNGEPIGLIEVVDNIQFSAVPVPSGVILAGVGVAGAFGLRRRFQKRLAV